MTPGSRPAWHGAWGEPRTAHGVGFAVETPRRVQGREPGYQAPARIAGVPPKTGGAGRVPHREVSPGNRPSRPHGRAAPGWRYLSSRPRRPAGPSGFVPSRQRGTAATDGFGAPDDPAAHAAGTGRPAWPGGWVRPAARRHLPVPRRRDGQAPHHPLGCDHYRPGRTGHRLGRAGPGPPPAGQATGQRRRITARHGTAGRTGITGRPRPRWMGHHTDDRTARPLFSGSGVVTVAFG
jgi:hypothetical protein